MDPAAPEAPSQRRERSSRRPSRRAILWAVGAAVLLTWRTESGLRLDAPYEDPGWYLGALLTGAWLLVGLVAWSIRDVSWRAVLSPVQRWLVAAVLVAMLVAQYLPWLSLYPFTHWSMYTRPEAPVTYADFTMLRDGDPVGHLPIADLVPNTLGRAFMARLSELMLEVEEGDPEAAAVLERTLRALMDELDEPVDAVDVRWCHVDAPTPAEPVRCESVLTVAR